MSMLVERKNLGKLGSIESKISLPKWHLPRKKQKVEIPKPQFPVEIVFVWANVFLAMCLYTVVWFACGLFVFPFITAIQGSMTFDTQVDTTISFIKACFLYHPIVSLIGWFIYGVINSFRSQNQTTPWSNF